jgi:hypothetical protein
MINRHLLAKSPHRKNPIQIFDTGYHLQVELHGCHLKLEDEHLENGRTLNIARCKFFDDHLGISPHGSRKESVSALQGVVQKLLNQLVSKKELYPYLKKKKFSFSELGVASLDSFRKPVMVVITNVVTLDKPGSLR